MTNPTSPREGAELERCDREIAEILDREDVKAGTAPAWLVTLGINDWQMEKRLIEQERDTVNGAIRDSLKAPFP